MQTNYNRLKLACYGTNICMSVVGNLSPLLFLTFRSLYGISYSLLGLLVVINFTTQLIIDLIFSFFSHRFNIEKVVKFTPALTAIGLVIYAAAPAETEAAETATVNSEAEETAEEPIDEYKRFCDGISLLTITERKIFDLYISGKSTAETAEAVGIKENTLKFHNKNIYQKLGVSSRKQLLYYANLSNETEVSEN